MKRCLADAAAPPHIVDYINAHGTSTPLGDLAETIAMKHVFEDTLVAYRFPAPRASLATSWGLPEAVELIASTLAIDTASCLPP